jgi:hypothetical protein
MILDHILTTNAISFRIYTLYLAPCVCVFVLCTTVNDYFRSATHIKYNITS